MKEDKESLALKQEYYLNYNIAKTEKYTWESAINQLKVSLAYD